MTVPGIEKSLEEQLSELFGSYKAEWLHGKLFELFTEPEYFPELQTARPCVLVGGRGTGKTTVLRCLSYEGQFALRAQKVEEISKLAYYGFYYRVNTNRVTAFCGPEVERNDWIRIFAHYLNLDLCDAVLRFVTWHQVACGGPSLSADDCTDIAASFGLEPLDDFRQLSAAISRQRIKFEAYINNITDENRPFLSLQGAPVDLLLARLAILPQFVGKLFFFLIDEYENFLDYQQQIVNTLLKHASGTHTFKIGVRELGWRQRTTLNETEQLISPADYVRIDISEKLSDRFSDFAARVCDERLRRLPGAEHLSVSSLLQSVNEEREATLLGVDGLVPRIRQSLAQQATSEELTFFDRLTPLQAHFISFWSNTESAKTIDALREQMAAPVAWATRFDNYKHASLFTIRKRKRGIRKYYAGWSTFTQLSGLNIRYLLELVEQSLLRHLSAGHSLGNPIGVEIQTAAGAAVGKKNLTELEGLSVHGATLTRLLLGLGRVFQVLASQPEGHTPEVNQFHLRPDDGASSTNVDDILRAAVMHLALLRSPGNKLQDDSDTKEYDYYIHPIYAPFFVFSHRKKRKLLLAPTDIIGLIGEPKVTIARILHQQGRSEAEPLPEQLSLFEAFYEGGS